MLAFILGSFFLNERLGFKFVLASVGKYLHSPAFYIAVVDPRPVSVCVSVSSGGPIMSELRVVEHVHFPL